MGSRVAEEFESSRDPRALCLYGDVLEAVAERVAAPDLVSASRVSREWRRAVRSALRRRRRPPWLLLRLHHPASSSSSCSTAAALLAYDPHSRTWLPPLPHVPRGPPPPRASPALHAASLSALAVARDPFGAAWRAVEAPRVWRVDPVVAATAGGHVAVIGGACQLALGDGEDAGAVEVRGPDGGWEPCDPIPAAFDGARSATWLSAAASGRRVYVADRAHGWTSWFDPETKKWGPTRQLRPDPTATSCAIGVLSGYSSSSNDDDDHRLVLATAGRREGHVVEVRLWEADADTLDVAEGDGDAAAAMAMPKEFARRMFQESEEESEDDNDRSWESSSLSVGLCCGGDGGYVYNLSDPRKGMARFRYYYCYGDEDGKSATPSHCEWEWIRVPTMMQKEKALDRVVVVGCAVVGLDDLAMLFPC